MTQVLLVLSSPRGAQSQSSQIAHQLVDELKSRDPAARLVVRDLARNPLPHVGVDFVDAIGLAPEQRSPAQQRAIAVSDELVDEVLGADVLVLAAPMHNFSLPSGLKAWIDHVARAGRTFKYTEQGPRGLLTGKKAVVVVARGGVYSDGPMKAYDFQEAYLRTVLGFLGITDVEFVRVEGLAMGPDAAKGAVESARQRAHQVAGAMA
jgi:FMN-dependent NADH-azoreductase